MKIIGTTKEEFIVTMTSDELVQLAGFDGWIGFAEDLNLNKQLNDVTNKYQNMINRNKINLYVSPMYKEAKETLETYAELKTKFESIRNQLSTLLKRMKTVELSNEERDKK